HNLIQQGYSIGSSHGGYRLLSSPDLLLPQEIPGWGERIYHLQEASSTMDVARELAKKGAEEGTVVLAESQTHGRGRLSREWDSPAGGIYGTLILKPQISPAYAPRINLMASVAVAKAIRKLFGLAAELKWPNDVLIGGRKVCGILAEMEAEVDAIRFVNLGIGINANSAVPRYEGSATSLSDELGKSIVRKELLVSVLDEIVRQQASLAGGDLLEEWKSLSATLNREVRVVSLGEEIRGRAIDIDSSGALVIRDADGSLRRAIAGDCIHI
ncbi:MAG: biotin--[acetyl-CoA-carboxylase] ligase, partial [Chloroflexota bacterium]|nr:biotin--[acetyl-CoA-carboxylase] ligase [Chloroflexota bacterium]